MTTISKKILYWSPRILCILFILFISIFAFDVFDEKYTFWQMIWGFIIHLIPSFLLLITLIISWRREWVGGVVFLLLAVLYIYSKPGSQLSVYLIICGPLVILSALFFLNWKYKLSQKK